MGTSTFLAWGQGGYDQSFHCSNGNCSQAKLTVTLPSGVKSATGSVTLYVTTMPVLVTFVTFENWSTQWIPFEIQVCIGISCSTVTNGQSLTLQEGYWYGLTAILLQRGASVSQWTTNAGSLSNGSSNPTELDPSAAGTVSLIAGWPNWAGYVYSPITSSGVVSAVSGVITSPKNSQNSLTVWAGMGGMPATNLWQAGLRINATGGGSVTIVAFSEYCPGVGGCYNSYIHWSPQSFDLSIAAGDTFVVAVASSNGNSTFSIKDTSRPGTPTWSGYNNVFTPDSHTGEWALESGGTIGKGNGNIPVAGMTINGVAPTLYSPYLMEYILYTPWTAGQLWVDGSNGMSFSLYCTS